MTYDDFSIMINERLKNANLTELDLSEEIGISQAHLTKILKADHNIPIHILNKVAAFFKMQLKIQIK